MVSEITPLLIITKLEQYDYAGATAIASGDAGDLVRTAARDQRAAGLGALSRPREGLHELAERLAELYLPAQRHVDARPAARITRRVHRSPSHSGCARC
jgi:hypothetical protein